MKTLNNIYEILQNKKVRDDPFKHSDCNNKEEIRDLESGLIQTIFVYIRKKREEFYHHNF